MSQCGGFCRWCIGFHFTLGLTALFLWLSLHPSKPGLSIQRFYVPALNRTAGSANFTVPPKNATIDFAIRLKNRNKNKGVRYGDLNLTLLYLLPNQTGIPAGNLTVPGFYQGFDKKKQIGETLQPNGTRIWKAIFEQVSAGGAAGNAKFKVTVAMRVRYKILAWNTKRKRLTLQADVQVDGQGQKASAPLAFPVPTAALSALSVVITSLLFMRW